MNDKKLKPERILKAASGADPAWPRPSQWMSMQPA
jgi:hypothetical protein